jgi:carbon starvation protein CstA
MYAAAQLASDGLIAMNETKKSDNNILWRYAGMGAQILAALGLALFIGLKLDAWIRTPFPLLVWLLPLLVIIGMIIKTIKDTSKPKHDK